MSDLSINTTLPGTNSMPSRTASSSGGGTPSPAKNSVPVPSEFITSPKGAIDYSSGMFVVQFRDGDGKVTMQYPAPKASFAYKRSAAVHAVSSAPQGGHAETTSKPAAKAPVSGPAKAPESAPAKPDSV